MTATGPAAQPARASARWCRTSCRCPTTTSTRSTRCWPSGATSWPPSSPSRSSAPAACCPPPPGYLRGAARAVRPPRRLPHPRRGDLRASAAWARGGAPSTTASTPDLVTFAKGVTSGYQPVGGVLVGPAVRGAARGRPRLRAAPRLHLQRPPHRVRGRPGQPRHHRARGAVERAGQGRRPPGRRGSQSLVDGDARHQRARRRAPCGRWCSASGVDAIEVRDEHARRAA